MIDASRPVHTRDRYDVTGLHPRIAHRSRSRSQMSDSMTAASSLTPAGSLERVVTNGTRTSPPGFVDQMPEDAANTRTLLFVCEAVRVQPLVDIEHAPSTR